MKPASIIQRLGIWAARIRHSRGFGVQSPSAYRFIRYVVNEHYPYYAYSEMSSVHPQMLWHERKMGELYLRLANYCQADRLVSFGLANDTLCEYIQHGCQKTIVTEPVHTAPEPEAWRFVRVGEVIDAENTFQQIITHSNADTLLVIEDIKCDPHTRQLWRYITESKAVSVTYDLYYCGIAFFDTDRYKQNYKVNF